MDEKDLRRFKEWAVKATRGLADSDVFMSLLSPDIENDPVPVIQIGYALLLDKPITLLVPEGMTIPENLKKVAVAIEFFEPGNEASMEGRVVAVAEKSRVGQCPLRGDDARRLHGNVRRDDERPASAGPHAVGRPEDRRSHAGHARDVRRRG